MKAVIMAGDVYIDNQKADKPGTPVKEGMKVETGEFGADMKIDFVNDGPVTIILEF